MDFENTARRALAKTKDAGKAMAKGYRDSYDKVTGANVAREVDAFQQEMETVYSAVASRIVANEAELQNLNDRLQKVERRLKVVTATAVVVVFMLVTCIVFLWASR